MCLSWKFDCKEVIKLYNGDLNNELVVSEIDIDTEQPKTPRSVPEFTKPEYALFPFLYNFFYNSSNKQ